MRLPQFAQRPAQEKPTEERQILVPRDRFLAGRTKGALRFVDRQIERQPINADIEKRADDRAHDERDDAEEMTVSRERRIHACYSSTTRSAFRCMNHAIQMQLS